jgi:hypothetical protein
LGVRLLITGGREYDDKDTIRKWIENVASIGPIDVIIHGANPRGADKLADELADELGIAKLVYPADWNKHGKAAGPIRNQQMIDEGHPTYVLAFPDPKSRGTWDMVRRAKAAGVKGKVVGNRLRKS